jgi:hypothetical protein
MTYPSFFFSSFFFFFENVRFIIIIIMNKLFINSNNYTHVCIAAELQKYDSQYVALLLHMTQTTSNQITNQQLKPEKQHLHFSTTVNLQKHLDCRIQLKITELEKKKKKKKLKITETTQLLHFLSTVIGRKHTKLLDSQDQLYHLVKQ